MSFYAQAEAELDNPKRRRENLWSYCKAHCDMDIDRAVAMYIREAAIIIEKEYHDESEWRDLQRERIEEEEIINKKNRLKTKKKIKEDVCRAKSLAPTFNKYYFALAGFLFSLLTFSLGIILNADGFFSYLWRVPVAIIHIFSFSCFMYTALNVLRYHFILEEKAKYVYIKDNGDTIYRFPEKNYFFLILTFFVIFIFYIFG